MGWRDARTIVLDRLSAVGPTGAMKPTALFSPVAAKGWLPWGMLAPFLLLAFVVAPLFTTDEVLVSMGLLTQRGDPIGLPGLYAFLLVAFTVTGLLTFAWVLLVERRPLSSIGLTASGAAPFFRGIGIGIVTIGAIVAAIWALGGYQADGFGLAFATPEALVAIAILLGCFMLQASVEEIIFRGWLMSVLARRFNVPTAVIVTSVVFMLLHFGPGEKLIAMASTSLFSLFACLWALKANNIWGVMGWHAGWNWFLATGFEVPVTGFDAGVPALVVKLIPRGGDLVTGGAEGPEASVICLAFLVGASALFLWRLRPRRDQPTSLSPASKI